MRKSLKILIERATEVCIICEAENYVPEDFIRTVKAAAKELDSAIKKVRENHGRP